PEVEDQDEITHIRFLLVARVRGPILCKRIGPRRDHRRPTRVSLRQARTRFRGLLSAYLNKSQPNACEANSERGLARLISSAIRPGMKRKLPWALDKIVIGACSTTRS